MNEDLRARTKAGVIVSAAGIACNVVLSAAKITAGFITGLFSVAADGFNNLSDCGGSAVTLASFGIAAKPADEKHPFGHRRAEYLASLIVGFLVLFLAVELVRESVERVIDGSLNGGTVAVYILMGVSVAVKCAMAVFYRLAAKKLQSDALGAAAVDSACDCAATSAVIAGMLICRYAGVPADGWAGLAVALFVLWQGLRVVVGACSELLGRAPDKCLTDGLRAIISAGEGVIGVHDLHVYGYGKGAYFATAHVEMSADVAPLSSHAVLDLAEHRARDELGVDLCLHLDPVDLHDEEGLEIGKLVRERVEGMYPGLEVHDIRLVRGVKPRLIFDVGAPYSLKVEDAALVSEIEGRVREFCDYRVQITLDRE